MARKQMNEVSGGGSMLGAGKHEVTITKVEFKETTNGFPKASITYTDENGEVAFQHLILIEKALGFTKSLLSACGYDIDDLEYEVIESGKKEGHVTAFYFEGTEYDLDALLLDEAVLITVKEEAGDIIDPVTGAKTPRDKPFLDVVRTEPIPE